MKMSWNILADEKNSTQPSPVRKFVVSTRIGEDTKLLNKSNMASLAEQLRSLTNPEPSRFDLDEDEFDLTRAQVISKESDLGDIKNQIESNVSNLRKKTVPLLQDEDKKYAGRKISRADLEASRGYIDGFDSEAESDVESDSEGDLHNGKQASEYEKELEDEDGVNADGDDDDVSDDFGSDDENDYDNFDNEDNADSSEIVVDGADDINDEDDNDDEMEEGENATENAVQSFSAATLAEDIEKGRAVKNQLNLWDSFLEMRIRLQKALMIANRLPQEDQLAEFSSSGDNNLKEVYRQGKKSVAKLLGNLLWMQEKLLEQNPDTANILHPETESKTTAQGSDNDEEIPSDTEDEKSDGGDDGDDDGVDEGGDEVEEEEEVAVVDEADEASDKDHTSREQTNTALKLPAKRKHDLATQEFAEYISKRHAAFTSYRDATISKWSEKTRLASGKFNSKSFSSFDRSTIAQINHILSDKGRLIKRTQLKRTSYRVLGKSEEGDEQHSQSSEEQSDLHLKDYDREIFDDDDFYHQLLREFIEQKTSGSTGNPVEMGRQWLELQKLRRKVKKKVDTKASKGRKIRYSVHGKLVSFMAPIEKGNMTDSSRNELFSSLFGAKQQDQAVDISVFR